MCSALRGALLGSALIASSCAGGFGCEPVLAQTAILDRPSLQRDHVVTATDTVNSTPYTGSWTCFKSTDIEVQVAGNHYVQPIIERSDSDPSIAANPAPVAMEQKSGGLAYAGILKEPGIGWWRIRYNATSSYNSDNNPAVSIGLPGTGYSPNDTLNFANGAVLKVDSVIGYGAITSVAITTSPPIANVTAGAPTAPTSTSGTGVGAQMYFYLSNGDTGFIPNGSMPVSTSLSGKGC